MADVYRSFTGFVKFDLNDGEVGDKQIRSFVIRNVGVKDQAIDVRCTLWPSHEDVEVAKGDLVTVEGKFTVNKKEDKTYFNLSVSNILNQGAGERGARAETTNGGANDTEDDEAY